MKKHILNGLLILLNVVASISLGDTATQQGISLHTPDAKSGSFALTESSNGYRAGVIKKALPVPARYGTIMGMNYADICEVTLWIGDLLQLNYQAAAANGQPAVRGDVYLDLNQKITVRNSKGLVGASIVTVADPEVAKKLDNDVTEGSNLVRVSPFYTNASDKVCQELTRLTDSRVVMHYERPRLIKNPMATTSYRHINTFLVKTVPMTPAFAEDDLGYIKGKKDQTQKCPIRSKYCGVISGDIIKVSYKGAYAKTWEMQVAQQGAAGAVVVTMSIPDIKVARYAILSMAVGVPVNIYYQEVGSLGAVATASSWFMDTPYLVKGIEQDMQNKHFQASEYVDVSKILADEKTNLDEFLYTNFGSRK